MNNFPSMRGSIDAIEFDTRAKAVEYTQSLYERRDAGEDVVIIPTGVWLQTIADLRLALDWQGDRPGPRKSL